MKKIFEKLYIKELDDFQELLKKESKNILFGKIIYIIKKIFCIITINDNIGILPYENIKNKFFINIIAKTLSKITPNVVLSNKLMKNLELLKKLEENNIYIYNEDNLPYYLTNELVQYITKMKREKPDIQEIHILVNKISELKKEIIIDMIKQYKRINIVTSNIKAFNKIEEYIEEKYGAAITITNNKRKSLFKSNIIVNFDFSTEELNKFNISRNAIILNVYNRAEIKLKSFEGINAIDYQIKCDENEIPEKYHKKFNDKILYGINLKNKKYFESREYIKSNNVKIVNLIGQNGIINEKEYVKK